MQPFSPPQRLIMIDIDGLRQDVFHQALDANQIPHLAKLLNANNCVHLDPASTAPSITFCAQSSIFTGQPPDRHQIPGNQFFDRYGLRSGGPRFYAFDVGDDLAYDDAVLTFTGEMGLVGQTMSPETPTLYELAAAKGLSSTVVYHMVSRGATHWIRPSLIDIARFTKGGGLFGLSAEAYDHEMMDKTLQYLSTGQKPDVLTVYFMGLDHVSHHDGPGAQYGYLTHVVDPEVGRLSAELERLGLLNGTLVVVVSDHGQIEVLPDDRHSLRLSFPFDREMGSLFDALGLDVHDLPGEGPTCDAVVASNGGMAHVYLRRRSGAWSDLPQFEQDVLTVARAFWEAHETGRYAQDLYGALSMVLLRSAEHHGWQADYQALTPDGRILSVQQFIDEHPEIQMVDAAARLRHLAGPLSGDLLLVSNYKNGFYFGGITTGVHGGLHPFDSLAVISLGMPGAPQEVTATLRRTAEKIVYERRESEGRSHASLTDLLPILRSLFAW